MLNIDPKVVDVLMKDGSKRKIICAKSFIYFLLYYFPEYFTYWLAPFHFAMCGDLMDLLSGSISFLLWVMFRESGKTSIVKIFIVWLICYNKKKYIIWDSYVKDNSEAALFDITLALQSNRRIIRDFGELYVERRTNDEEKKLKRVSEFITSNGIKVQAFSTQESVRGRVTSNFRPDFAVLDDFETFKTVLSMAVTLKIRAHIDELMAGLSTDGVVVALGNLISEAGNVQNLIDATAKDPKRRMRRVDVVMQGQVAWEAKYVLTDKEAVKINTTITDPKKYKVSLESKQRSLNAGGRKVYEVEMLNNPEAAGDIFFDRKVVDKLVKVAPDEPKDEIAGFKIWHSFNPSHRYALGADTSMGVGRDSNASCIIDLTQVPNRVVATYKNNLIKPDIFAHELKRQGNKFGQCFIAPESNAESGGTCLNELLRIYDRSKIYIRNKVDHVKQKIAAVYGWETNASTKPEMLFQLKSAIENGMLIVEDKELLKEFRAYSQIDLITLAVDPETTRHFDLLIATAIAWAMRNDVPLPDEELKKQDYKQPEFAGSSLQQGGKVENALGVDGFYDSEGRNDFEQPPFEI